MKTRTMSINDLVFFANTFMNNWNTAKAKVVLNGKSLFALIGLKRDLEAKLSQAQETIAQMAERHGGVFDQQVGGYRIPEENQVAANEEIAEFSRGEIEITYAPVIITANESIPIDILEAIFDFVEMAE